MATPERTKGEQLFQCALDLHNAGRQISRQHLVKITGFPMGIVDDHVTRFVDNGRMRRVANGVLEIVEQFPANRAISKTVLPDGTVKIEVGDDVMQLTPSEAGVLGANLMPEATVFAQLRGDRDIQDQVAKLHRQREEDKRRIEELVREVGRMHRQAELQFD